MKRRLDLILRTCSKRNAHPIQRTAADSKLEIIRRCLLSLVRSAELSRGVTDAPELRLFVVDDASDPVDLRVLREVVERSGIANEWLSVEGSGNGDSLATCYRLARARCDDLIYFVEDDYLHERECIGAMLRSRELFSRVVGDDLVLHPLDNMDRYQPGHVYPSIVALGDDRHWRSVLHTTGTILVSRGVLERFWHRFEAFTKLDKLPGHYEDGTINQIYREIPCLAPIGTLAYHLGGPQCRSPFRDWRGLWDSFAER